MTKFSNKEEYQKWKEERIKEGTTHKNLKAVDNKKKGFIRQFKLPNLSSKTIGKLLILIGFCVSIISFLFSNYDYEKRPILKAYVVLLDLPPSDEVIKKIWEDEKRWRTSHNETMKVAKKIARRNGEVLPYIPFTALYTPAADLIRMRHKIIAIPYRYILAGSVLLIFIGIGFLVLNPNRQKNYE